MAEEFNPKKYEQALDNVNKMVKSQKALNKLTTDAGAIWDSISNSLFQISGADFFKEIKKSPEEMSKALGKLIEMEEQLHTAQKASNIYLKTWLDGNNSLKTSANAYTASLQQHKILQSSLADLYRETGDLTASISNISSDQKTNLDKQLSTMTDINDLQKIATENGIKDEELIKKMTEHYDKILDTKKEFEKLDKEDLANNEIFEKFQNDRERLLAAEVIKTGDLSAVYRELSNKDAAMFVQKLSDGNEEMMGAIQSSYKMKEGIAEASKELENANKKVFSLKKGFEAFVKNIGKDIMPALLKFDTEINKLQMNTGMNMDDNAGKMTELINETQTYGMGVEKASQYMEGLSLSVRSMDTDRMMGFVKAVSTIERATGASQESVEAITQEFAKSGKSAEGVEKFMEGANSMAQKYGVSSKAVIESIGKNLTRMRKLGFTGGEESLIKMTAMAENLRINIDDIFNVAERARNIEGALEMAAELQLAAGSFANINPMDLMSAARKGPEELGKILTNMGSDIGRFNKKTGEYDFDPVDVDRLQIVAKATGMEMDALQEMIRAGDEENRKLQFIPDSYFSGIAANIDGIDKDLAKSMLADMIGEDGTIAIDGDIRELKDISQMDLQAAITEKLANEKTLKERNEQNASFEQAFAEFKATIVNAFTTFQPVLTKLTEWLKGFTEFAKSSLGKWVIGLTAALLVLPKLIGAMGKFSTMMNPKNWGQIFKSGGIKNLMQARAQKSVGVGAMDGVSDIAKKEQGIPRKAGGGLKGFVTSLKDMSKEAKGISIKGIAKLSLSILMLAAPLTGLALIYSLLGGDPMVLVALGFALVELAFAFFIMGKTKVNMKNLIMLALAMAIIGVALIPFAYAAGMLTEVDWGSVLIAVVILMAIIIILAIIGNIIQGFIVAFAIAVIALIAVGFGLLLFAYSMLVLSEALTKLAAIPWSDFGKIVGAIFILIPALAALALAGLMFVNPITLFGIIMMIGMMGLLAAVMIPLGDSFEKAGSGMEKFVDNIQKLKSALNEIDLDKLEELSEYADMFSNASTSNGLASAVAELKASLDTAASSGGGGDGEKVLHADITLRIPSGEVLFETQKKFQISAGV